MASTDDEWNALEADVMRDPTAGRVGEENEEDDDQLLAVRTVLRSRESWKKVGFWMRGIAEKYVPTCHVQVVRG